MSDDDKAHYKQKAKGGAVKIPRRNNATKTNPSSSLLTSQGVPVSLYEQEQRDKEIELEKMRRRIDRMVQEIPLLTGIT